MPPAAKRLGCYHEAFPVQMLQEKQAEIPSSSAKTYFICDTRRSQISVLLLDTQMTDTLCSDWLPSQIIVLRK